MKFVIAALCLSMIILTTPTNAHPEEDCKSPWTYFVSLIGGEAMKMGKMMLKMKMQGSCMSVNFDNKFMELFKDCAKEAIEDTMEVVAERNPKSFGREDVLSIYKGFVTCKLMKGANIDIENGVDKKKYLESCEKYFSMVTDDEEASDHMIQCAKDCSNKYLKNGRGDAAIMELTKTEACMTDKVFEYCAQKKKSPGMFLELFKAVSSYVDEPKCDVKIGNDVLVEPMEMCLKEATVEWNKWHDENNDNKRSFSLSNNDDTKTAFKFLLSYVKYMLIKSCHCSAIKLKFMTKTDTNIFVSKANTMKFILDLKWTNMTEKDAVVSLMSKCYPSSDDKMLMNMNAAIENCEPGSEQQMHMIHKKLFMYKMKMDSCSCQEFIQTCGLNNDLAKMMHPFLNFELMSLVAEDFVSKGGKIAIEHMKKVIGKKLDFFDD